MNSIITRAPGENTTDYKSVAVGGWGLLGGSVG